jgi:hypothetical protein
MKRIAYALSFVAAAAMAAAPLAAQTSNGPWWDPGRTQTQTRGGTVYGRQGNVYGNQQQADGQWRAYSRDRNGNTIYMRTRYDSNGNLIQEYATRNILGRYNVISQQVLNGGQYGTYGNQGVYGNRGSYDRQAEIRREQEIAREQQIRQQEIYRRDAELRRQAEIRQSQNSRNDRWVQNDGHDNGKHNGQYKDKDKNDKHHGHDH